MDFITEKDRIVCVENGTEVGEVTFPENGNGVFDINHTFVDKSMQGRGIAAELVDRAVKEIRNRGGKVAASCSYARKYIEKMGYEIIDIE